MQSRVRAEVLALCARFPVYAEAGAGRIRHQAGA